MLLLVLLVLKGDWLLAQTTPGGAASENPPSPGSPAETSTQGTTPSKGNAATETPAQAAIPGATAIPNAGPTPTPNSATESPNQAAASQFNSSQQRASRLAIPATAAKTPSDAVGPDTYWIPDKNGRLQQVVNMYYEDFIKSVDLLRGFGVLAIPPYTIQSQKITGKASDERVELRIELKILLHTDQQVRIPLGLNQAVLSTWKYEGDGQQFWNFEDGGDGYVCWLRGPADKEHTIVMEIVIPVVKLGGETALRFGMPPALASELTIDVDVPNAVGRVADEDARKLSTRELATGTTQVSLAGVHGDFELAWRPADRPEPKIPTELSVTGTLLVRIDGPSIQTDARLNLSSSGGEFEQFSLRLPPGAKLLPGAPAGYELAIAPGQTTENIAQHGALIDVKLSQKTSEPIEIRLRTEQSRSGKAVLKGVDFAGFNVINAARQWGYIAVEVVGDWQVHWVKQQNVRRIERLPDMPVTNDPIASFEYFGQPFVLTAQISPRPTRVRVEPEYVVSVGPTQLTLDGRLKYNIRGANEFALVVSVPGWEDVEVESVDGIDDKNILREQDQLTIPLKPARTGPFELRLKAHRAIVANVATFSLPVPRATTQTTATLVVAPEDNVELIPRTEELQGLSAEHVLPHIELPVRQQEPLIYRGELGATQFTGDLRILPQLIEVDGLSTLELNREACQIEQKFSYRVDYEPVDHINLRIPAGLPEGYRPEISFNGQILDATAQMVQTASEEDAESFDVLRIRLPAPAHFGRFELSARYSVPLLKLNTKTTTAVELPLYAPESGIPGENSVDLLPHADIRVVSISKPWQTNEEEVINSRQGVRATAVGRPSSVQIDLEVEPHSTPGTTLIDLAWIQSWFTNNERQDRACYRFTTSEDHLDIQLPAGISPGSAQVVLDGFPVAAKVKSGGQLSISLSNTTSLRRRHLELQYRFGKREQRFGTIELEAPQPLGGAWVQTTYWQVILPADELLITTPTNFVNEFNWGWGRLLRGRQPLYEQAELEALVGASAGMSVPASTNRYLFRDLGAPASLSLSTARVSILVFAASLLVLTAGLAVLYFPAVRKAWVAALATMGLLPLAAAYPTTTILVAQAAAVGLVLTLFAILLRVLFKPAASVAPVPEMEPSITLEPRSSTRSYITGPSLASDSSAATTIALHTSEVSE
jgi:hypothetical protein